MFGLELGTILGGVGVLGSLFGGGGSDGGGGAHLLNPGGYPTGGDGQPNTAALIQNLINTYMAQANRPGEMGQEKYLANVDFRNVMPGTIGGFIDHTPTQGYQVGVDSVGNPVWYNPHTGDTGLQSSQSSRSNPVPNPYTNPGGVPTYSSVPGTPAIYPTLPAQQYARQQGSYQLSQGGPTFTYSTNGNPAAMPVMGMPIMPQDYVPFYQTLASWDPRKVWNPGMAQPVTGPTVMVLQPSTPPPITNKPNPQKKSSSAVGQNAGSLGKKYTSAVKRRTAA